MNRSLFALVCVPLFACASGPPPAVPEEPTPLYPLIVKPKARPRAPKGTLFREDVVKTVQDGLGRFLQHVSVEPRLEQGKFVGWTIVSLDPPEYWSDVDLMPGDIVTRVNGQPIERDTEAYAVFEALKNAQTLQVSYVRGGVPRSLEYRIINRGPAPAAIPTATPRSSAPEVPAKAPSTAGSATPTK